ncbi:MAG: DUF4349 domain-containing protein [Fimbriimonadaceae bacterium]|nr:DUF4349 domain-containing protein [Fimbriimonadaceae bacterium]
MKRSQRTLCFALIAFTSALASTGCSSPAAGDATGAKTEFSVVKAPTAGRAMTPEATLTKSAEGNAATGDILANNLPTAQHGLVIRTGELTLRVKDLDEAERTIQRQLKAWGGFVETSQGSGYDSPSAQLSLGIRVPERRFTDAIAFLESVGTRLSKSVTSEDVTGEVVDLEARQRTMTAQEESYRLMLRQSSKLTDSMEIHDRLMRLRSEIEASKARSTALRRQAAYSDISVSLQLPIAPTRSGEDPNWLLQAWNRSMSNMLSVLRGGVVFVVELMAFAPYLIVMAGVVWLWRRRRTVKTVEPGL